MRKSLPRWVPVLVLAVYVAAVVKVAVWPAPGFPPSFRGAEDVGGYLRLNSNFVPFVGYSASEAFGNLLLTVPFGLLLPFAVRWRTSALVASCVGFGAAIETAQIFIVGHSVDITDAIFNIGGALAGLGIVAAYRRYRSPDDREANGSSTLESKPTPTRQ